MPWNVTFVSRLRLSLLICLLVGFGKKAQAQCLPGDRPNILFCITDDQSWVHTSAYGHKMVKTPHFDRLANEGILFTEAYAAISSCTPSRGAILTGRNIYELESGGILGSHLPTHFDTYQDILERAGYLVGFTGKGVKPGYQSLGGRTRDPAGPEYNSIKHPRIPNSVNWIDYAGNLELFLKQRQPGQPFSLWVGAHEPHRPYGNGNGQRVGLDPKLVEVPPFLPDVSAKGREELTDYLFEIQWFDQQLGRMIDVLEKAGELDNTLIVVTSDNGMPFPRAKMELYEYGTHMPLAMRWGEGIFPPKTVTDFVSLKDLAPTFLEVAGVPVPAEMTAKSLLPVLLSSQGGRVDPTRDHCFAAHERHGPDGSHPRRAIYTDDYLYIYNYPFALEWPSSLDSVKSPLTFQSRKDQLSYSSILWQYRTHPDIAPFFELYRGKRAEHELFLRANDPFQMHNLAYEESFVRVRDSLHQMVMDYSAQTGDLRAFFPESPEFDLYQNYSKEWSLANQDLIKQDTDIMNSTGRGIINGGPVAAPSSGPNRLDLLVHKRNPARFTATLSWEGVSDRKNIISDVVQFFDEDRNPILPVLAEICVGSNYYELTDVLLPGNARFIGVGSANQSGIFFQDSSLAPLPKRLFGILYPQPTRGPLQLNLPLLKYEELSWQLTDQQGRLVRKGQQICQQGACYFQEDISQLPAGMYYLHLETKEGDQQSYPVVKI